MESPKIVTCAKYSYTEENVPKNEVICSGPSPSLEAAEKSLHLYFLLMGRLYYMGFHKEKGSEAVKVCANVAWGRKEGSVTTGGKEIPKETLPRIHLEKKEICTENRNLEEAQKKWEQEAVQFVKSYPYHQYRDPRFQKTAEEAQKSLSLNWKEPPFRGGGRVFY